MPPRGYRSVTLREEVYRELEALAREKGLTSINDAVRLLLEYRSIYSKLEHLLQARVRPAQERGSTTSVRSRASKRIVRWVRDVRDPERYFEALSKKLGEILWVEKEQGVYCYAPREEIEEAVAHANEERITPEEVTGPIKELSDCGLVYHDGTQWRIID